MEINPDVIEILQEFKIDKSQGLLALLGIYFKLDVDSCCDEETVKAINLTKIVDKDYNTGNILWTIPLFKGEEAGYGWVLDWISMFKKVNPERAGSPRDAVSRMQEFFKKYSEYRKDDVYKARDLYFRTLTNAKFCMKSHKFIFDGVGAMKKSTLLEYCEKVKEGESGNDINMKGRIAT